MIESARSKGFREILGVIALPNDASEQLHERMGFVLVGRLPKVGYKFGRYIDVSFWQWSLPDTPASNTPTNTPTTTRSEETS
jgi:phosphinothricin acetyltransferase